MSAKDGTARSSRGRRGRGFDRVGVLVERPVRDVGESRGFAVSRLLTHWQEVAGPDLAKLCRPVRAGYGKGSFGATLTVLASGAAAPIVQARLPELRARVNACYGYSAISRIRITQTAPDGFAEPAPSFAARSGPAPIPPEARAQPIATEALAQIKDPDLRAAMTALAARLSANRTV